MTAAAAAPAPAQQAPELPNYVETKNPSDKATRWLFTPADIIDPKRKRELPHLRFGGAEYSALSLRRTPGFIPRLVMTPLEMAAEWVMPEMITPGTPTFAPPPMTLPTEYSEHARAMHALEGKRIPGVQVYPGDDLQTILTSANNDPKGRRGVVEITKLFGLDYNDNAWRELQEFFFGFPNLAETPGVLLDGWPRTLREARAIIEAKNQATTDTFFRETAGQMLAACDDFAIWGQALVGEAKQLLKIQFDSGFSHQLSPVTELVAAQLEIPLEDDERRIIGQVLSALQRSQALPVAAPDATQDLVRVLMERDAKREEEAAALRAQVAELMATRTAVSADAVKPTKK